MGTVFPEGVSGNGPYRRNSTNRAILPIQAILSSRVLEDSPHGRARPERAALVQGITLFLHRFSSSGQRTRLLGEFNVDLEQFGQK